MARTIAKDYGDKCAHIQKVAAQVFATQGYGRASMAQVASACGISKANIYHYYDSKDAILFDVLDTYLSALRDRLAALPLAEGSAEDALHLITREMLLAYQGMDHEHRIQTEGLPLLGAAQQEVLKGYQRDMVQQLSAVLAQVAPEVFRKDKARLRATTMSVFGMLNWFYKWNGSADAKAREDYAALVAQMTISGVRGL